MVGFINNFAQKKSCTKKENKHVGSWRKKVVFVLKNKIE